MNIIFLDVDGVLNSWDKVKEVYFETRKPHSGNKYPFDEESLECLQMIVLETNAKIVITSSWRREKSDLEILFNILKKYDLDKNVIGCTPILNKSRELEIRHFLANLDFEPNFIILDDDSTFEVLLPYLVKTSMQTGLQLKHVEEAINKFDMQAIKGPIKRLK